MMSYFCELKEMELIEHCLKMQNFCDFGSVFATNERKWVQKCCIFTLS